MSKGHPPPVPPAGRSPNGPGSSQKGAADAAATTHRPENRNLSEQGRHGNIRQNTTHQGYQQDR